jgi:type I restriction enzyme S subunit
MTMPEQKKAVVPRLRFPEFRDAGPWEVKRLGDVCDVLQGYGFPHRFQGKQRGKYPFCKVSDVTRAVVENGGHITSAANYIDEEDLLELRAQPLPPGTTIFARIGEALRSNNRAITDVSCVIDNNVGGLKALQDIAIDYFVFCLAQRIDLNEHCGGAVPSVNKTTIESIKVAIPGAGEQQKIADCLSSLDELIELEAKQLEALQAHKKGLMQQLFPRESETTPRLRFPEFRDAGPWEVKRLGDVCEVNPASPDLPDDFIYIDLESVESGRLLRKNRVKRDNAPIRAQRLLKQGDILYQTVRPYQRNNLLFTIDDGEEYVASTGYAQLRAYESGRFLFQLLHTDAFVYQVLARCTGTNYPAINSSDLEIISVPFPSLCEQQKIADCLSSLDELIELQAKQLESLQTHKKGLMQQLFPQGIDL